MSQSGRSFSNSGPGGFVQTLTGDIGGPVPPTAGNINIITDVAIQNAGSSVLFSGSPGTSTITFDVTDANGNSIVGQGAGNNSITGTNNTALGSGNSGFQPFASLTTGANNCSIGYFSSAQMTTGNANNAFGQQALIHLTTGTGNTCIGDQTGNQYTSSESYNICIGSGVIGTTAESNTLRIGAANGTGTNQLNAVFIAGINGFTPSSPVMVTIDSSTNRLGTAAIPSGGETWSVITANQTASVNNGYFNNKPGTLALALPATSSVGDVIEVVNINTATGSQITQAAGQQIFMGNASTTSGATGTITSTQIGDTLRLVCSVANDTWWVVSSIGTWTLV